VTTPDPKPNATQRCPVCKKGLEFDEYKRALKELQRAQNIRVKQHKEDLKVFRNSISELKSAQLKQLRILMENEERRYKTLHKKFEKQRKDEKRKFTEETMNLKNRYKVQIEQTRELYSSYSEKLVNKAKLDNENMLSQVIKRYEELAENSIKQIEGLRAHSSTLSTNDIHETLVEEPQIATRQDNIISGGKGNKDEKSLELERLKELKLIGQMIKEIAQAREDKT
jgi:hypothetical protein